MVVKHALICLEMLVKEKLKLSIVQEKFHTARSIIHILLGHHGAIVLNASTNQNQMLNVNEQEHVLMVEMAEANVQRL